MRIFSSVRRSLVLEDDAVLEDVGALVPVELFDSLLARGLWLRELFAPGCF